MSRPQPFVTMNNGRKMPLMGFGTLMDTLQPTDESVVEMTESALDIGYRHIDTASVYNTESGVGKAVRNKLNAGLFKREDVFITTKLWRNSCRRQDVVPALKKSLERLGLDYVDLYLIHWPNAFKVGEEPFPKDKNGSTIYSDIDYLETWQGMEECVQQGLTKAIGLSNFNSKQIQRVLDNCHIKPANCQIETHPFLSNRRLIEFCHKNGITVAAYAPLAGFNPKKRAEMNWPTIFTDDVIGKISKTHQRTPAEVALRFQIQRNVAVLPKSANPKRLLENFEALEFELNEDEMKLIESRDCGVRLCDEHEGHPHYPFNEEF